MGNHFINIAAVLPRINGPIMDLRLIIHTGLPAMVRNPHQDRKVLVSIRIIEEISIN